MTLLNKALQKSHRAINACIYHPFNKELMSGHLAEDIFAYYLEQDLYFLEVFARCHKIIASKIPIQYANIFAGFAKNCLTAMEDIANHYFVKSRLHKTSSIALATIAYNNFLLRICLDEPIEASLAAILPCFIVYQEVYFHINKHSVNNNPYKGWISKYCSKDFAKSSYMVADIFMGLNKGLAEAAEEHIINVFYKSVCFEWHFWNDSYYKNNLCPFI